MYLNKSRIKFIYISFNFVIAFDGIPKILKDLADTFPPAPTHPSIFFLALISLSQVKVASASQNLAGIWPNAFVSGRKAGNHESNGCQITLICWQTGKCCLDPHIYGDWMFGLKMLVI